jgi:hypothetical protein
MQIANQVFDKDQRTALSNLLLGLYPGTVSVARYSAKVKEKLNEIGIELDRPQIHQIIYRASNNQDTYRAIVQILQKERPMELEDLFNGQLFNKKSLKLGSDPAIKWMTQEDNALVPA